MAIQEGPGGPKQKAVKTRWPVEEGLTAGTQRQKGRQTHLIAEEGSNVPEREKVGL